MTGSAAVPAAAPVMIAWAAYKQTEEYANAAPWPIVGMRPSARRPGPFAPRLAICSKRSIHDPTPKETARG